jgi:tetratricopeptide (TPR) repeat protein
MYNAKVRYALMAMFIIAAIGCLIYRETSLASLSIMFFAFVLWSHFKQSSVLLASNYFKKGDYENAARILREVPNADRLAKNRRGYYEFMQGNIALKAADFEAAERHFQIASRFPLGRKNDKAYVMIHLGNLALRKKDKERAFAYVNRAKELAETSKAKEIINKIEIEASRL